MNHGLQRKRFYSATNIANEQINISENSRKEIIIYIIF